MTNKDPVDAHIGSRLREAREFRRMTLGQIARGLGLTYQQIRKYESGENRLSASRLYSLALLLKVDPDYFFQGLDSHNERAPVSAEPSLSVALSRIGNPEIRYHLKGLIDVLDIDFADQDAGPMRSEPTS